MMRILFMGWRKIIVLLFIVGVCGGSMQCSSDPQDTAWERNLPRVLFLTTGLNYGNGSVAAGVSSALRGFNKYGIPVYIDNREALYDSVHLAGYDVIIALTASGYHDADRKHSLIYLTHEEMEIMRRWVYNGGMLIAGDNIGRYYLDGTDRALFTKGRLSGENWPLGKCFGVTLQERHMDAGRVLGNWNADSVAAWNVPVAARWRMFPVEQYPAVEVAAWWQQDTLVYPAVTHFQYGSGKGVLLGSSYLLHPVNAGGLLGEDDIQKFYEHISLELLQPADSLLGIRLHPWPHAAPYALCVTLDAEGTMPSFERIVNALQDFGIDPGFYVNAHLDAAVEDALRKREFSLYSAGFEPLHTTRSDCYGCRLNVLRNEHYWGEKFTGIRFPGGGAPSSGLHTVADRGYLFDATVKTDNVSVLRGGAIPYNIPLNNTGFSATLPVHSYYASSDLVEIASIHKDDYVFFSRLVNAASYTDADIRLDAARYERYLQLFLKNVAQQVGGVASYYGHVSNTGFNNITVKPLQEFIRTGLRDSAWITGIEAIAEYRKNIHRFHFTVREQHHQITLRSIAPQGVTLAGCTISTVSQPRHAKALHGGAQIIQRNNTWYVVFDAQDGQELTLQF